jgi:predicted RNA polymerase sigma factor
VARVGRPGQPGRLAHGDGQASRHRPDAPHGGPQRKTEELGRDPQLRSPESEDLAAAIDDPFDDDLLRLVFTACHPVLSTDARVALTLRLLCGLTTKEIARAYLTSESTVAQRIVRAKRTLSAARVPFAGQGETSSASGWPRCSRSST